MTYLKDDLPVLDFLGLFYAVKFARVFLMVCHYGHREQFLIMASANSCLCSVICLIINFEMVY